MYKARYLKLIIGIGFCIRIFFVFASSFVTNFDLESYTIIGNLTAKGISVYPSPALIRYPYPPFFIYLEALAHIIRPYDIIFLKFVFSLFDVGIIYLIFLLTKKVRMTLMYAINPISILITCVHGQFDAIPLFFLLLACYLFEKKKEIKSIGIFSLAIAVKAWPVFFIAPFVRCLQKKSYMLLLPVISLLGIILYAILFHTNVITIINVIRSYRAVYGIFGTGFLLKTLIPLHGPTTITIFIYIFLALFFIYSLFLKRKTLRKELTELILLFFTATPVFGIQWLMWLVPFLVMEKVRYAKLFFVVTTIYLLINYAQWIWKFSDIFVVGSGILVWITILIMSLTVIRFPSLQS